MTTDTRLAGPAVRWQPPFDGRIAVLWAILLLLGVAVLLPLVFLFRTSTTPSGLLPFESPVYTWQFYVDALFNSGIENLVVNTLIYAAGSTAAGIAVATFLAWLVERTDIPFRAAIGMLMFVSMPLPNMVVAFGWVLLINPGNGYLNLLLQQALHLADNPFNVYSMTGMVFITAVTLVPTAFAMIAGLLRNIDPQLDDAAAVHGGTRRSILTRVTVPLLGPGIFSITILIFLAMLQAFDVPLIIGLTARVHVLSTRIYILSNTVQAQPNYGLTAAFGMFFLALAVALILVFFRIVRRADRYAVVTGKGFKARELSLGRWRMPALAAVGTYFAMMLVPLMMVLWMSLLPFYRQPSWQALTVASPRNYATLFGQAGIADSLRNTLVVAVSSATIVMGLSLAIAWFSARMTSRLTRLAELLAFAPAAMPSVVLAVALLLMLVRTPLFGTIWIVVLAHSVAFLAFGTRTMSAAVLQIHRELENAAVVSGASWSTTVRRIAFPLLRPQMIYGWLWVVAHSARDITFPLLLTTSTNGVAAGGVWILWDTAKIPLASALAMTLVLGILMFVVPLQIMTAKSMSRRA
jgi:iron(III) transport system permease protein